MFTWKLFYSELIRAILPYRNRQGELIQILRDIKAKGLFTVSLEDKDKKGKIIPLSVIDPFTFFANFNRGLTTENNKTILGAIKNSFSLKSDVPEDFNALPVVNSRQSWFFPYQYERKPGDINALWDLAENCIEHGPEQLDQKLFKRCLGINTIGPAKLTMGLFWLNPEKYLPLDSHTVAYLRNKGTVIKSEYDLPLSAYVDIINDVSKKLGKDFTKISYDAYGSPKKQYWAGGIQWGDISKLGEFVAGNYWQIGWPKDTNNRSGQRFWKLIEKINVGDEFALKSYGGSHDLTVHYIGEVVGKDADKGIVRLERLDRPSHKRDAPRGPGAGNWQGTLLEVKRPDVIAKVFGIDNSDDTGKTDKSPKTDSTNNTTKAKRPDIPLNLILYGPPGTGKTYRMTEELAPKFTTEGVIQTETEFLWEKVSGLTWWQVIALVLLDIGPARVPAINGHKLIKAKDAIMAQQNCRAMIWAMLQSHTVEDCPNVNYSNRNFPLLFSKEENGIWNIDVVLVKNDAPELLKIKEEIDGFKEIPITARRYQFVTFHQSYSYEDFVEGIRPVTSDDEEGAISYKVQDGIFKHMVNRAMTDPTNFYALFIDEINRANISKVFGELITLVEDDKRMKWNGADGKWEGGIQVKLPYTHAQNPAAPLFGVPENLYIIGTMNTADRSIAILDTALRRRFEFEEIMPDSEILAKEGNQFIKEGEVEIDLVKLLETMNRRIEFLYDREHQIGHSYLLKINSFDDLKQVFLKQIIPLLQEYFYDDWEKIQIVFADLEEGNLDKVIDTAIIKSRDPADNDYIAKVTDQDIEKRLYSVNKELKPESIRKIYR